MKTLLLSILVSSIFFGCSQNTIVPKLPILGLWKLHVMEVKNDQDQWKEWRQGMGGYLLYQESGYMSLHLTPKSYPDTDLQFMNFTDTMKLDQLKYISQNYNYTGSFTVNQDSSIISHTKLSHSNPNEWGEISRRKFSFVGDTLFVVPTEEENASLRLKFLKLPSQTILEH